MPDAAKAMMDEISWEHTERVKVRRYGVESVDDKQLSSGGSRLGNNIDGIDKTYTLASKF